MGTFAGVELDDLVLSGHRLILRPWRDGDAERVYEVMQDRRMAVFLPVIPTPYSRGDAVSFVADCARSRRDATSLECAVTERDTGRVVGAIALRLGRHPEIGYWVAADRWGRGYAAEAVHAVAEWGFARGITRIQVLCDVRNVASVRVALSAGFAYEGVSRGAFLTDPPEGSDVAESHGDLARFARLADDNGDPIAPVLPPLPAGGLTDGVLELRVVRPSDAPDIAAAEDAVARRWGFGGTPLTEDTARAAADSAGLDWLVSRSARLAMLDRSTGAYAGGLAVRTVGPPRVGLLGYTVHPAFRGRGYTTRALRLFAAWAFEQGGFARLELGARVGNVASQRAALNAGFTAEGVYPGRLPGTDGRQYDEARFGLLNPAAPRGAD